MEPNEKYLDVLQNIESAVVQVWRHHPSLTNYSVMRAYEAAIAYYGALARQHAPKPVNLTGQDAAVFEAVKSICELRLGRVQQPEQPEFPPLPAEELVACLRKLRKSVDHWTKAGGRQGYLQFIEQFLP